MTIEVRELRTEDAPDVLELRRQMLPFPTGTRRAFRGRGLARTVKHDSLTRSRAAGYREAFTGNDADNAPMLAVNRWFGYEPFLSEWRYVKEL